MSRAKVRVTPVSGPCNSAYNLDILNALIRAQNRGLRPNEIPMLPLLRCRILPPPPPPPTPPHHSEGDT